MASFTITSLLIYIGCLYSSHLVSTVRGLESHGCEDSWFYFKGYCYSLALDQITADEARNKCHSYHAELTSVWTEAEANFIVSVWQFPREFLGSLWTGLRGTASDDWKYDDLSKLTDGGASEWSLLKDVPGIPATTSNKCVALLPSTTPTAMDCDTMDASAYVCKKALLRLFLTSGISNRTQLPAPALPLNAELMFQRLFPPRLTLFPPTATKLAEYDVIDDVSCAYKCFSNLNCMIYQLMCHAPSRCTSYKCTLFPHTAGFL